MKAIVIYTSKYGSTKRYATLISEKLGAKLVEQAAMTTSDITDNDVIIYGGGLYASTISGLANVAKERVALKGKKLIVFSVGIANPENPSNVGNIRTSARKSFPDQTAEGVEFFHLRGDIDYKALGIIHKAMMATLIRMLKKKPVEKRTEEDLQLLAGYGKKTIFMDEAAITPLVEHVLAIEQQGINACPTV